MLRVARNDASKFFKTAESGVDKVGSSCEKNPSVHWRYMNFLRQRKTALDAPLYAVSAGRSMIEMLGVLAIIAVLTVGGIAGYSKAMEKFKLNKAVSEYSYIIFGALEHLKEIQDLTYDGQGEVKVDVIAMLDGLNLFPNSWKVGENKLDSDTPYQFEDPYGNWGRIYSRNHRLSFNLLLGNYSDDENGNKISANYSSSLCLQLMQNLAYPLHETLYFALLWHSSTKSYTFYGDAYCQSRRNCLAQTSLAEMHEACSSCSKKEICAFVLEI